jgi:hypothetical protein
MRTHTRFPALVAAALVATGCLLGASPETFKPAMSPAGVEARLRFRKGELRGELIEVRDSGLVVAPKGDVVFVPFTVVRSGTFAQTYVATARGAPSPEIRERLRLLSRFPNGLPADQFERFLASRGRQSLRVFQP